jgi:uncharacterized protein YggU (UPF0235/DUF167 family)
MMAKLRAEYPYVNLAKAFNLLGNESKRELQNSKQKMTYIKIFVTPSAKREKVEEKGDVLVIAVKEPASGNHANDRVREVIAERFKTPLGKVRILTGHHSRVKMVSISG